MSSASGILAAVLDRPLEELTDDLERVRTERAKADLALAEAEARRDRLATEEVVLAQLVALRQASENGAPMPGSYTLTINDTMRLGRNIGRLVGATPGLEATASVQPAPGSKREMIVSVMRSVVGHDSWKPAEMRKTLDELYGITATTNNIAVTMRRMWERGQLRRLDDGRYTLPQADTGALDMGGS